MTKMETSQARKLVDIYSELNDLIMDYTDAFHDEIYYDIIGYENDLYESALTADDIENLKDRVKACMMLHKALVMFNDDTKTVYC